MSLGTLVNRIGLAIIICTILVSCTRIRKSNDGYRYKVSDRYFDSDYLPLSEEEFASTLNYYVNLDYYEKQSSGERYAHLAKRELSMKLDDNAMLKELENSIEVDLVGKPTYIAYFDIKPGANRSYNNYRYYYERIMDKKRSHPENNYFIVCHIDYIDYDENFIELHKEGLLKIDAHGVLDRYIPYPGHFEDHWMAIDKNLNVKYYLGEGGFKIFLTEEEIYSVNGRQCFEETTPITNKQFHLKRRTGAYFDVYSSYEEQRYAILIAKEREGQLEYESFKKQFSLSLGVELDYSKPLVIAYFESVDGVKNVAHKYLKLNRFENQIRQNPDVNHLFILDKDYELKETAIELSNLPVLVDRHGLIERVISKYDVKCENWIGIRPDGSYYLCYGEAELDANLKAVKEN